MKRLMLLFATNEAAHRREVSVTTEPGSRTKLRLAFAREGLIQISPTAF